MSYTTEIEKKEKSKVLVKVSVPFSEVEAKKEKAFQELAKNIEVDGFRKGNVPENVLKEKISDKMLLERASQEVINEIFPEIIQKNELKMIGYPKINVTKLAPNEDMEFTIELSVYPEIELGDYKKFIEGVKFEKKEATDEDLKKLEENILNLVNQQREKEGKEKLTELNDEVTKLVSPFETVAEFREQMKKDLVKQSEYESSLKFRSDIADRLIENIKFDVPEILVEAEAEKIIAQQKDDVMKHNVKWEEYLKTLGKTENDLKKEYYPDAEKRAKLEIILKEIFKKEGLKISKEEADKQVEQIKAVHKDVDEENIRLYVENILINEEVMKFLEKLVKEKN